MNLSQLCTWNKARALASRLNGCPVFKAAGITVADTYIPTWTGGPPPSEGNQFYLHFRFSNGMEGMNCGLVRDKFNKYPTSPLYVESQLLIEVQEGART